MTSGCPRKRFASPRSRRSRRGAATRASSSSTITVRSTRRSRGTSLRRLSAAQRSQPEVAEVLVGGGDDCERVAGGALGEADLGGLRQRAGKQCLDASDSCRRQGESAVRAGAADRAARLRGVADERLGVGAAVRAARQMREVAGQPEELQLEGQGEWVEGRASHARGKTVEEIQKAGER